MVVPTFDEAGNIVVLLGRLEEVLRGREYEIVVVDDDSADGTAALAGTYARTNHRVTVIRRVGERGLSSAVMVGLSAARGRALVVMDADLQHDERKIPDLIAPVLSGTADLCVGSRHADGGGYGPFGRRRRLVSWAGTAVARGLLGVPVSDPMSGFFALSRRRFDEVEAEVNARGFKILLEFLARGPEPVVTEIGYQFGARVSGSTKLTAPVVLDYLRAVAALAAGRGRRRLAGRPRSPSPR